LNISFVTKKKQIGSAVKRNKIKRRLRNIANEAVKKISINFNYSYLVIAKITMLNNEYTIMKDTFFKDFKKIK
jgi:ribonuclease P protein component